MLSLSLSLDISTLRPFSSFFNRRIRCSNVVRYFQSALYMNTYICMRIPRREYREVGNDDCFEQKTAIFPGFTFVAGAFVHDIGYGRLDLNSHRAMIAVIQATLGRWEITGEARGYAAYRVQPSDREGPRCT